MAARANQLLEELHEFWQADDYSARNLTIKTTDLQSFVHHSI